MTLGVELGLTLLERGRPIRRASWNRSLTYAGMEWAAQALADPNNRPPVAGFIGIGYGSGAGTPFDPDQTDLQGANRPRKPATYTFDAVNRAAILEATWGPNDPGPSLIFVQEVGLFVEPAAGVMIDRVVVTPWPKEPEQALRAHAVIRLVQSRVAYQFI